MFEQIVIWLNFQEPKPRTFDQNVSPSIFLLLTSIFECSLEILARFGGPKTYQQIFCRGFASWKKPRTLKSLWAPKTLFQGMGDYCWLASWLGLLAAWLDCWYLAGWLLVLELLDAKLLLLARWDSPFIHMRTVANSRHTAMWQPILNVVNA